MLGGFFIFTHKGDLLLWRMFRNEIDKIQSANAFKAQVVHSVREIRSPVHTIGRRTFFHVKRANLYLVAVTADNINSAMAFQLLYGLCNCFETYFGAITEDSVRSNFSLIYEILDEVLDNGYVQNVDPGAIRPFITLAEKGSGDGADKKINAATAGKMTMQATGAVSWRSPDIRHKQNTLWIDVVETVNVLVGSDGKVLTTNVSGQVLCKCFLSGMPECKLGMNDALTSDRVPTQAGAQGPRSRTGREAQNSKDKVVINDFTFHQCVKLGRFDKDRTVNFIPPDGSFELLKYRKTSHIYLPFKVTPLITEVDSTRMDVKVTLKAHYDKEVFGTNIELKIPLPANVVDCKIIVLHGKAKFKPAEGGIIWRVKRMRGQNDTQLSAQVTLDTPTSGKSKPWSKPPLSLKFEVPITSSGLNVKYVRVFEKKLNYTPKRWVRYICQSGLYEVRPAN